MTEHLESSSGAELGSIQNAVHAIWCEILNKPDIDRNLSFFDAGGNSVLMIKTYSRIVERFHVDFSITDFFAYSSINTLSEYLYKKSQSEAGSLKGTD